MCIKYEHLSRFFHRMMQNHRRSLLMKRSNLVLGSLIAAVLITFSFAIFSQVAVSADKKMVTKMQMPFGGKEDVTFANDLWKAMKGYENWLMKSDVRMGMSPHGDFIRLYYNIVNVNAKPYHVIVKDNYGGDGVTLNMIFESPEKYLMAVTVMVQREKGYDSDNNDWFWVKYNADGTVSKGDKDMAMAGRVAKGMDTGCIACHKAAKDNDYIFTNDGS